MSNLYLALAVIGTAAVLALIVIFNRFIRQRQLVREAWSGIDVQLKRRHDLILNIVEAVKGYAGHERAAFEGIASLRSAGLKLDNVERRAEYENALTASIRSLFAVAEAYPELKASENFLKLQDALVEVEDNIQYARRYYNGSVRDFNIMVEAFPSNMVAALLGFRHQKYFEIERALEREAPELRLSETSSQ